MFGEIWARGACENISTSTINEYRIVVASLQSFRDNGYTGICMNNTSWWKNIRKIYKTRTGVGKVFWKKTIFWYEAYSARSCEYPKRMQEYSGIFPSVLSKATILVLLFTSGRFFVCPYISSAHRNSATIHLALKKEAVIMRLLQLSNFGKTSRSTSMVAIFQASRSCDLLKITLFSLIQSSSFCCNVLREIIFKNVINLCSKRALFWAMMKA